MADDDQTLRDAQTLAEAQRIREDADRSDAVRRLSREKKKNITLPPGLEKEYKRYRTEMGEKGEEPLRADEWLKTARN